MKDLPVDFIKIIVQYPLPVQELALSTREFILKLMPEAFEVCWLGMKTIGYGTGPKKNTDHFSWLIFAQGHVSLGFNYGSELPDPQGILEGSGKMYRHVKIRELADLEKPGLKEMMRFAMTYRVKQNADK